MRRQDRKAVELYLKRLEHVKNSVSINPFETKEEQKKAIERSKKDFGFMVQRYFPHYASSESPKFHVDFANMVKKDQTFKGFAQWGRSLAKSVVNNIFLPFWLFINDEPTYFVLIGNNANRGAQLLEDLRAEFEANPQIIKDFGEQHSPGNWEEGFFITRGGFIGQSLGMGQSVRGLRVKDKRPTHIVADDIETKDINKNPKRQEEIAKWIERDLIPTMDGPYRRFIQANNKFAAKMIQTILQDRHPDWIVDDVKAYDKVTYEPTWPEKYSENYFRDVEKEIGILAAHSEYNNEPHVEGSIFLDNQIQYAPRPRLNQFKIIYGWWDVAYAGTATSDYNAVVVQGLKDSDFWVLDVFCKQSKMAEAIAYMCLYQMNLPKTVVVHWIFEAQFWNDAVKDTIKAVENQFRIKLNIIKRQVSGNKYDRILTLQPYYQGGRIFYCDRLKHHNDAQVGITQLKGIEPGYKTKDDYPDAHQSGIKELERYVTYENGTSAEITMGNYAPSKNYH